MRILIILPTYNEAGNVRGIAEKILSLGEYVHILIVDDHSIDGTREIAGELAGRYKDRLFLLERPGKLGLGSAYVRGFRFALEKDYDYAFEMDSDFSHDPLEIPNFLEAAKEAEVVIGSRYIGGIRIMNWPLSRLALSYSANAYARNWCQELGFRLKEIPIIFTERKAGASKMSLDIVQEAFWLGARLLVKRIINFNLT